jgi:hypothetical protein
VDARCNTLETSAIAASLLSERLGAIGAGRLLVLLDACHAGGAGTVKDGFGDGDDERPLTSAALDRLSDGAGRAIIASSRLEQTSLILPGARNSAFTTALLEGLGGAADVHGAGTVRLFGLYDYVAQRVPALTNNRQQPLLRTKIETNFAIALAPPPRSIAGSEVLAIGWRERLQALLPDLYPAGPTDRDIWERAGGDLAALTLGRPGRSIWFEALKLIAQGGGGDIDIHCLIKEALKDYPRNVLLLALS